MKKIVQFFVQKISPIKYKVVYSYSFMKIVAYYRISRESNNSVRLQRKRCREYCLKNRFNLVKEYVDDGFSGNNKNRPAMNKMLNGIDSKKIKAVLVYKVDRLGRDFEYLNDLRKKFEEKKVKLISATQAFDSLTPRGKVLFIDYAAEAEYESKVISERTKDGLRAAK